MADYNANIKVNADTRSAEQAIKRLTTELDKIKNVTTAVKGVKNIGEAFVPQQALSRLEKGLQTISNRANTTEKVFARLVEGVGTLGASGAVLSGLNEALKGVASATGQSAANFSGAARKIDEFAAAGDTLRTTLAQVNNLLVDVGHGIARTVVPGFAAMDDTAQATAQTANRLQYALQQFLDSTESIRTFVSSIGTLEGASGAAAVGLAALAAVVEGQLSEALYDIDASASTALKQLAEDAAAGASELQRLIRATQGTVEQYENLISRGKERMRTVSAESDEARRAANTITQGQRLLNEELERQNDLLREARGLTQTGLEERKAVKSLGTKRRREDYLADLAQGVEATLQAAAELDQEILNLDKHLADLDTAAAERRWQALEQQWKDADAAGAALAARMDEMAAASLKARGGKEPMPFDTGGVVRRTIAGPAYEKPAGPAGAPFAVERALAAQAESNIRKEFQLRADYEAEIFRIESNFNKEAHFTELEFIQKELEAEIDKIESVGRAQQKADAKALRDFDKRLTTRTEARQKRRQMMENVVIGGAFPMLFGGGPGAVLGGAAGGFIPGNPMLSVATSALGAMVDQFATNTAEMGNALRNPIESFQELAEKGLLASKSQEKYIQKLIEAGRVYEASAIIQDEIIQKIGVQGYKDLQNAGAASEKLNKAFAELSIQMQAAVAGPLAAMLSWLANVIAIGNKTTASAAKQTDILQGLSAQDRAALQQQEQRILSGANIFNEAEKRQQVAQLYQSYSARANMQRPGVTVDSTAAQQAAAQTRELQAQVDLSAKQLSLVGLTLEKDGQRYINAAKDVALQEYKNRLLEITNSWIGKAYDAEKNTLMIRNANLQYAAKLKNIDAERVKSARDQLEVQKAILALQTELIQTTLQAADIDIQRERLRGGDQAGIQEELQQLQARLDLEARSLDFQVQQKLLAKDLTTQERNLIESIYRQQLANLTEQYNIKQKTLLQSEAQIKLEKHIADVQAIQQARQPFEELRNQRELDIQYSKTYLRLVTEGILPAEAERQANFERLVAEQLTAIDRQIAITKAALVQAEAYGVSAQKVKELREELERLEDARGAAAEEAAKGPGPGAQPGDKIKGAIAAARGELNELVDLENQVIAGAAAIGDAFQQSFKGLVTGAMTGQEALASFFKNVGDHFLDMASKMIAKLIEIYILETIVGLISGAAGGGGSAPRGTPGATAPNGAAYFGPAFAEGGFVTGPTRALIGEGGEPEYVIPASKMRTAMGRYSAGARGSSVVSGNGEQTRDSAGGVATMEPIDVRYSIERINNVDYVTADQFQAGMAQAAQRGAIEGERRAMRTLQNSAATRRRVNV